MASQIDQLRLHFNGLNTMQKKEFIDKLQQKLMRQSNVEYSRFLNECIQKYNSAVRGNSVPSALPSTLGYSQSNSIEAHYEAMIQLYLNNGYQIAAQAETSTMLVFMKYIERDERIIAVSTSLTSPSATYGANVGGLSSMNRGQQHKFQVMIRITTTGQLQITGFTLEEKKSYEAKRAEGWKIAAGIVIGGSLFFLFLFIAVLFNS